MQPSRKPRIKGLETEYSIKAKKKLIKISEIPTDSIILDNPEKMVGNFLPNGARYYIDSCKYPEYATPECLTIRDLVIADKAGEKILLNDFLPFCRSIQKANYGIGQEGFFTLKVGTRGCHENYLIDERLMKPKNNPLITALTAFLISRQILAGRGGLYKSDNEFYPVISKRAFVIETLINDATTLSRPIIGTSRARETFSDYGYRLHLILGDTNISEYSTFLKIGTTDLMLTLLENNFLSLLWVKNPVAVIHKISADIEFKNVYEVLTPSGQRKKMSALDIQFWYLDLAQKFFERMTEPTEEEKFILNLWQETLDGLKRDPMSLSDRLDYLIVLRLFEEAKDILGSSINDEKLKSIDFLYSEMLPKNNLASYQEQVRAGNIKRLITDQEIDWAIDNPFDNTRAKLRGDIIKIILQEKIGILFQTNWDIIYFLNQAFVWGPIRQIMPEAEESNLTLRLSNPYLDESPRYDSFKNMIVLAGEKLREKLKREKPKKEVLLLED